MDELDVSQKMKNQKFIVYLLTLALSCSLWAQGKDVEKKIVNVGGLVVKPGVVDFKPNTTIYAMILAAGGPTEIGTLTRVELHRGGKVRYLNFTHEDIKNKEQAQPNDTIVVRQKFFPAG